MIPDQQADRWLVVFPRDCRAMAAVEFAIVFPVILALMAGAFELSQAVQTAHQLGTLANSISTMLATTFPCTKSTATPSVTSTTACTNGPQPMGVVTYIDLHYAFDSAMLIFPLVLSNSYSKGVAWGNDISISMAGVSFTPTVSGCTSGCTYKANVVWTGASEKRACGTNPTSVPDTAEPSPTTLPADLFYTVTTPTGTAAPLFAVVVDVNYAWTPLIFSSFFGTIIMQRSAYITPRNVSQIKYSIVTGDDGFGKECPGF